MAEAGSPISDLSDESIEGEVPESPSKSAADKATLDQSARNLLNSRGYPANKERSGTPSSIDKEAKDSKSEEGTRRATRSSARLQANQIQKDEVVKSVAPYVAKSTTEPANALQETQVTAQALQAIPSTKEKLATLLTSVGAGNGSTDILALDPSDRLGGYSDLEAWVDGSLDMYKVYANPDTYQVQQR